MVKLLGAAAAAFCVFLFPLRVSAQPVFVETDRVLILAPHPDDEMIGASGVLQQALQAGASVKVLLMTNGENNRLSFMFYKKRPLFSRKTYLEMGEVRRQETLQAMRKFGLGGADLISLGYPDFGTLKLFTRYWQKPYASLAARSRQVPQEGGYLSPGAVYTGANLFKDIKTALANYRPTHIFVSHPADENRDHRALYLFMRAALWDLEDGIPAPDIYPYLVHFEGWPAPDDSGRAGALAPPPELSHLKWHSLPLGPDRLAAKTSALKVYASQIPYAPEFLPSYARPDEIFSDYPDIPLPLSSKGEWIEADSYNRHLSEKDIRQEKLILDMAFARQETDLLIRFRLKKRINRLLGASLFLIGYQKDTDFAEMPKIKIRMRMGSVRKVSGGGHKIKHHGVKIQSRGGNYELRVPLKLLNHPDYVLTAAQTRRWLDLAIDETAWRVLNLSPQPV